MRYPVSSFETTAHIVGASNATTSFLEEGRCYESVVRALPTESEGPGCKISCAWDFVKIFSDHPPENSYLTLFRAGKNEGDEEEEWRPISVILLPVKGSSLTVAFLHGQ